MKFIWPFLHILRALRIFDSNWKVSFTALYLYSSLVISATTLNLASLALVFLVLIHANLKRLVKYKRFVERSKTEQMHLSERTRLDKLESEVKSLSAHREISKLGR